MTSGGAPRGGRKEFSDHLARLKAEFDRAFAAAPIAAPERDRIALLRLSIAGDRLALKVSEVRGLHPCRALVPVPSRAPEALGVIGMRGALVPVFSLARLAGYPVDPEPPRWLVLCGGGDADGEALGLAFAHFDGHVVAPAHSLRDIPPEQTRSPHAGELVNLAEGATLVLSLASIVRRLAGGKGRERGRATDKRQMNNEEEEPTPP